jgi:ABC-type dipeptide/oligopeptide/nickel transport system permease component
MSIIEQLIYSFSIAYVLVRFLEIKNWHPILNRKPFKCLVCMSGWVALILHGFGWMTIPVMCLSMVLTAIIDVKLNRYFHF